MGGSPRVERAARIRLENPNLTTEEAMKLSGYSEEEAKDQKRQSNVRQKTHRLSKGRKRLSEGVEFQTPDAKRVSYPMMSDAMYQQSRQASMPLHMPDQGMIHDYARMPMDLQFSQQQQQQQSRMQIDLSHQHHPDPMRYPQHGMLPQSHPQLAHQHQQMHQQQLHPHQHQHSLQQSQHHQQPSPMKYTPARSASRPMKSESSSKSPGGSPRVEKAARMRLEDPTVSTEEAMKLAGFTDEEAKDRKKQNNVRQKTHRLSMKQAPKSSQKKEQQELSVVVKDEVAKLEVKIDNFVDSFERRIELKLKELGDRIDAKFDAIMQLLDMQSGLPARKREDPDSDLPLRDPDPSDTSLLDTIQM